MKRFGILVLMLLLLGALLCACDEPAQPPVELQSYTVTFLVGDSVYTSQTVTEGQCPSAVALELEGLEFAGWADSNHNIVTPETIPVTGNISYIAQGSPRLTLHMPYLQVNEFGFLRPEELLTADELEYALKALSKETAWSFFPELPASFNISGAQLRQVLTAFFPEEQVRSAVTCADTDGVTRAMFAAGMHTLLGRDDNETFILGAGAELPKDVTCLRTDIPALLEACMRHTADPEGQLWSDISLPSGWDPGFVMLDGWLYFVLPDGMLLRNGTEGKHYFGPDGRYTCGDKELDAMVADILKTIMEENPELEGLDLLRKVYDHCHQNYKYLRKEAYSLGATGWEIEDAKEMFQTGRGNCYNFAAIFWALAKGLGYDVVPLAGTCTGSDQPHGWVGLYYEGTRYFVDPEWQYAYTERKVFDKDMFMLTMDRVWWWTYKWDKSQFPSVGNS